MIRRPFDVHRLHNDLNRVHLVGLGRELHGRLGTLAEHFSKLRGSLDGAVKHYNAAVGSLEHRVLVTARRFEAHGAGSEKELVPPLQIDRATQDLQAPELALAPAEEPDPDARDAA